MHGPAKQKELTKILTFSEPGTGELLKKESFVHLQKRLQNDFAVTLDLNTRKSRAQGNFSQRQSATNTIVELVIGDIANVQVSINLALSRKTWTSAKMQLLFHVFRSFQFSSIFPPRKLLTDKQTPQEFLHSRISITYQYAHIIFASLLDVLILQV